MILGEYVKGRIKSVRAFELSTFLATAPRSPVGYREAGEAHFCGAQSRSGENRCQFVWGVVYKPGKSVPPRNQIVTLRPGGVTVRRAGVAQGAVDRFEPFDLLFGSQTLSSNGFNGFPPF